MVGKMSYILFIFAIIFMQALILNCPLGVYAAGNDDLNDKEIGVEWVNDYSGTAVVVLRGREK